MWRFGFKGWRGVHGMSWTLRFVISFLTRQEKCVEAAYHRSKMGIGITD
jgi:hypothetical protein